MAILHAPGLDAREVEDLVDEPQQVTLAAVDPVEGLALRLGRPGRGSPSRGSARSRRSRSAGCAARGSSPRGRCSSPGWPPRPTARRCSASSVRASRSSFMACELLARRFQLGGLLLEAAAAGAPARAPARRAAGSPRSSSSFWTCKLAAGAVRLAPRAEQLVLVLPPLAHRASPRSRTRPPRRCSRRTALTSAPTSSPGLGAEHQEDLLGAALEPEEREPVRLVEDPAADGEDPLDVPADEIVPSRSRASGAACVDDVSEPSSAKERKPQGACPAARPLRSARALAGIRSARTPRGRPR